MSADEKTAGKGEKPVEKLTDKDLEKAAGGVMCRPGQPCQPQCRPNCEPSCAVVRAR